MRTAGFAAFGVNRRQSFPWFLSSSTGLGSASYTPILGGTDGVSDSNQSQNFNLPIGEGIVGSVDERSAWQCQHLFASIQYVLLEWYPVVPFRDGIFPVAEVRLVIDFDGSDARIDCLLYQSRVSGPPHRGYYKAVLTL